MRSNTSKQDISMRTDDPKLSTGYTALENLDPLQTSVPQEARRRIPHHLASSTTCPESLGNCLYHLYLLNEPFPTFDWLSTTDGRTQQSSTTGTPWTGFLPFASLVVGISIAAGTAILVGAALVFWARRHRCLRTMRLSNALEAGGTSDYYQPAVAFNAEIHPTLSGGPLNGDITENGIRGFREKRRPVQRDVGILHGDVSVGPPPYSES
ncbi:hypothetical protein B0H14DRAFT_2619491 [Mycena olivaceomarginata]|nr:hypothetical protein B0H14DRAFT_2619491 [Mycena olivaceomarginata]